MDDDELDREILLVDIQKSIYKAEKALSNGNLEEALKLYQEGLDILEGSYLKEDYDYIKGDLYYNKALCRKNMLQDKICLDFSLKNRGFNIVKNYNSFKPNEIINDFLMADEYGLDTKEHKSEIYVEIGYIYCEALKDYEMSRKYEYRAIETGFWLDAAYLILGNCDYEEGDYKKAIENYKKVSSTSNDYKTAQENICASQCKIYFK